MKLKDIKPSREVIENKFLDFELFQTRYLPRLRRRLDYKHNYPIALALATALGVEEGKAVFEAVRLHTTTHYARMNNKLRSGGQPRGAALLDTYVKHAPKVKTDVAYRGVGADLLPKLKRTFTDPGFMTVSPNIKTAARFPTSRKRGAVLVISGIRGRAVEVPGDELDLEEEPQFLLPRNTSIAIDKVDGKTIYAHII